MLPLQLVVRHLWKWLTGTPRTDITGIGANLTGVVTGTAAVGGLTGTMLTPGIVTARNCLDRWYQWYAGFNLTGITTTAGITFKQRNP